VWSEDAADWIDRTVRVEKISALTLEQWVSEYLRLKKVNAELMHEVSAAERRRGSPSGSDGAGERSEAGVEDLRV
jgi:hypothetical protein